ncbi:MAG: Rare lipoprotein A precursor [uncultured Sulfurovum sp.]|uniref:Probable endolytic peptidoglycan transglycosylase RlpA n=1 Tax=uncultured Sulfurovum sp. TaxID=269237 RepID=A0A6S6TJE0_9BACT|nr:MAG: Rare lipoprotein A precursor [uncultured Sulfurovum sp.]
MNFKLILLLTVNASFLLAQNIGDASWYGKKFQGKTTASGEAFDMYAYTTAHRTFPFGTILTVTNLSNNKSVDVRVNDRGPHKLTRIVDLSYQAAKKIGIIEAGIAKVSVIQKRTKPLTQKIQALYPKGNPYLTDDEIKKLDGKRSLGNFTVKASEAEEIKLQIASFNSYKNANNFLNEKQVDGVKMEILNKSSKTKLKSLYKVVILCDSKLSASKIIASKQYNGAYILP